MATVKVEKSAKEAAVEAKINAKIEALKAEALSEVEQDQDILKANEEDWANRYRCKVSEVSRRGAKNIEMYVNHPKKGPRHPYRLNIKLGEWIEEGLPMSVINRLQNAFDTDAQEKPLEEMTGNAGEEHKMFRTPRFAVQVGKLVSK